MSFTIYDKDIIMCSGDTLLMCDLESGETSTISLPKLQSDRDLKVHNNVDIEAYHGITAVFTSSDGDYFCACTNRKQLCLYRRSDRSLIANRTLVRAASKARFTPGNDVVVADKSGDAYLFSTKNPEEPGQLILGHLSMLLDVLVTEDNRHVVTTDRDEKIRISLFPNSYNILSYCLGHKKFVTSIAQLPMDKDTLLSAGGDGHLKFWNYKSGKELSSVDFGEKILQDELKTLNENLKRFELTETVETLPAKHLCLAQISDTETLGVISIYSSKRILVYMISKDLSCEYLQSVIVEEEPLECIVRNRELWILDENALKVYIYEKKKFRLDADRSKRLEGLNRLWSSLRANANKQSLFPTLYKRKYDNVQEYQERKKSRLENS